MKILIKANNSTYNYLTGVLPTHVSGTWCFQIRQTLRDLGHIVDFIGTQEHSEIKKDFENYDVLFFHQLPSFNSDIEYSKSLLQNFKGIKIYYSPNFCGEYEDIFCLFDYIFVAGTDLNYMKWKNKYKKQAIMLTNWQSSRFDIIDDNEYNPYNNSEFKLIYCGILIDKFIETCKKLAEDNLVYIGGMYYSHKEKACRDFTDEEIKTFPSNLKLINNKNSFTFGQQFNYLKHANVGLVFQESYCFNSLRHKLVEYLVCGLPCLVEESTSNGHWVDNFDAGYIFEFDNYESLKHKLDKIRNRYYDRELIKQMARERFSQHRIYKEIFDKICKN